MGDRSYSRAMADADLPQIFMISSGNTAQGVMMPSLVTLKVLFED